MSEVSKKTWDEKMQVSFEELLEKVKVNPSTDTDLIQKAFEIANKAHKGQYRASNEPYIIHPLEVAKIVADLNMDTPTIVTALLHDTIEDTSLTYKEILSCFDEKIATMVQGISKLTTIESKNAILNSEEKKVENYRNLMCAVSKDIRVLIVKLADRLHNMRTLHCIKDPSKRRRIANETMDIHSALAERIGIHSFKNELQDLAFAELYPKDKLNIERQLNFIRKDGTSLVQNIISELKDVLSEHDIGLIDITGREKKLCSIWRKLQNKKLSFENLSDVFAFRIIVEDVKSCYNVLCAIHNNYHMVPGGFKDYISTPKTNGYKSLHTIIIGPKNTRIEIQIRTDEMHKIAEFGVAAHWHYKQQQPGKKEEYFAWISEILSILQNSSNPNEVLEYSKLEMHYHQVFCFTPKGELIALPKGATALDFAFYVNTDVGLKCIGAIVNKETVPIIYELANGDQVEIICSEKNKASELWLEVLNTGKAKTELRKYLDNIQKDRFIEIGKANYKQYLRDRNIKFDESKIIIPVNGLIKCKDLEELFLLIGQNKLRIDDIVNASYPYLKKNYSVINFFSIIKGKIKGNYESGLGKLIPKDINLYFSECCYPVKGEQAIEVLDEDKGRCVHRVKCKKVKDFHKKTKQASLFDWKDSTNKSYNSKLILLISNKVGSLRETVNCIFNFKINIVNITTTNKFEDFFECSIIIEVKNIRQLEDLTEKLNNLELLYSSIRYIAD
jgi:guanosine-3',5'-bis(diphosphate) 3'-pyrophosphohydrolase